jgi:RNA polymerase sigma factor (sigma-70 family)
MKNKHDFITTVKANEGIIYKVAKLYTLNKQDEQDLYQDIVLQLWKSFDSFRNDAKISTWIYRIALNTSIVYLTREKKRGTRIPMDEVRLEGLDTSDSLIDQNMEVMHAHIKELNIIEKGIILLYLEGNSYEEIATITGFTSSNIGTRLGRIKQKLKAQIKK